MNSILLFTLILGGLVACIADQPKPIEVVIPGYPRLASGMREEGEVAVDLEIDFNGKVSAARAISGPERLRPWAQAAALQCRFESQNPGMAQVKFVFALQKGLTDPPATSSIFTFPYRVVVIAERRDPVVIADPPLENMGTQKKQKD